MNNTGIIPGNVMRLLSGENKADNIEVILQEMISEPGTVVLTELQAKIKERLIAADNLMRQRRYSDQQVIRILCNMFNQSPATSRRDLYDAQHVFGSQRSKNKMYLLTNHIDRMEQHLILLAQQGKWKEWQRLNDSLTRAIQLMPDATAGKTTPAAIILNFTSHADLTNEAMDAEKAAHIAKQMGAEDIDYEELKDITK